MARAAWLLTGIVVALASWYFYASTSNDVGAESLDASSRAAAIQLEDETPGVGHQTIPGQPVARIGLVSVNLPGGFNAEIPLSLFPSYEIFEPQVLRHDYYEWVERARNGDLDAAHSLFRALRNCRAYSYRTEDDLEKAIVSLYNTHTMPAPTGDGEIHVSPTIASANNEAVDLVAEERWLRDLYSQCQGLDDEQLQDAETWLMYAAHRGSLPALRELTAVLPPGQEKFDYFELAWSGGDIMALYNMASMHAAGWEGRQSNPQLAYVEYQLFLVLLEAAGGGFDRWSAQARSHLDSAGRLMTETDVKKANALAFELLSNNESCCVSPYTH